MKASVIVYSWSQEFRGLTTFKNCLRESSLCYYASDVLFDLGYSDFNELEEALKRASSILDTVKLPIQTHIRSTFRGENYQFYRDWKLSGLALHLLKINGNTKSKHVANYQLQIYSHLNKNINLSV